LGKNPIIDAPFSINYWRKDEFSDWVSFFNKVAIKRNVRFTIIRCLPPNLDDLKRRISQRNYEWDQWKIDHWKEFVEREPADFPISHDDILEIVSNEPVENMVSNICSKHLAGVKVVNYK
jgi:hypothetical protein